MEKSGIGRWLLIGLAVFLAITFLPKLLGNGTSEHQPLKFENAATPATRKPEQLCDIWGARFRAQLTTQGADLKHFYLTTPKYQPGGHPLDLSTTPDVELRRQLRFHLRNEAVQTPAEDWQIDFDEVDYDLVKSDGKSCEFVYRDAKVELTRVVRATERPYEIEADITVKNLSNKKLRHAATVQTVAWRTQHEVEGGMFRVSPFMTHVECVPEKGNATRLAAGDFEPGKFKGEAFTGPLNVGDWNEMKKPASYAAVSNAYFSHAVIPVTAPGDAKPVCQMQIEDRWDSAHFKTKKDDKNGGSMYRARLAYPPQELAAGESAKYEVLAYVGPKERNVLAAVGGGKHDLTDLIDLGFFSVVAKVLVAFLLKVYSVLGNWGLAIMGLTITARFLLFPLAIPSVKSMIKMRELKPELDALNEKFKDDPQGKGLAQMELWRKHNVNPLKGCLPQLASMPVWFALYTTLQTAVELYNIPFLWFPDLSQPDRFFILPFIIGATNFAQQKLLPMQGDPAQQKMMLYFMPAMFTVFMLFLPAGLGVYMFTNGVLTIVQQQIVEAHVKRQTKQSAEKKTTEIDVKIKDDSASQGKKISSAKLEGRPVLGKGKA